MSIKKLRVAVCGGGIASLCLAHGLSQYDHLDIKIFEKSAKLRDEGAAVGLGPNAQNAMAQLSSKLYEAIAEAGGVPMDPMLRVMLASGTTNRADRLTNIVAQATGPNSGKHVHDVRLKQTQIITYWRNLYHALYNRIPSDTLQLGKGTTSVEELSDGTGVRVHFDDGSTYEADALVGCDGINSVIREAVLGSDHPALKPVYSDRYNHRVVIPMEQARSVFGEEYCSTYTQHGWIGDSMLLITDLTDFGTAMQVISDFELKGPWPHSSPFVEFDKDKMVESLKPCGEIGKAMTKVFSDQPKLYAACLRYHLETPTFCKGQMCIAGDAAMAFLPFMGAGAGQAIEDALILSTVLGACHNSSDVCRAFEVYDAIRRPRRMHVSKLSDGAATVLTGQHPDIGLDPDRLADRVQDWGASIYNYDFAAAQQDALDRMALTNG